MTVGTAPRQVSPALWFKRQSYWNNSMPILYRVIPDQKVAYIKASGKVNADEIMREGARMFAETDWENGFNILCDYRNITELDLRSEDINRIASRDRVHEPIFDKSKCAVVAENDLIFGLSRMWEIVSEDTSLTTMIFRDIREAIDWLEMDVDFLAKIKKEHE